MVRSLALPLRMWVLSFPLVGSAAALSAAAQPPATRPATQPAASQPRIVQFQPGIRINWPQRQVEVDVTVILREGPIELFACSPHRREHEAIVRIEALPTHLFQALGLIGLTPGQPARMDDQGEIIPASGDRVDVEIRYHGKNGILQEPIEFWMRPAEGPAPAGRLPWVFAGSIPLEHGKGIASDLEGTVVAVVDFPTALIAIPEHHTDRNEALWLRPNTEHIPPVGTTGQMIIRAAPLRLELQDNGEIHHEGRPITRDDLARLIARRLEDNPDLRVEILNRSPGAKEEASLVQFLRELKIRRESIVIFSDPGREKTITR